LPNSERVSGGKRRPLCASFLPKKVMRGIPTVLTNSETGGREVYGRGTTYKGRLGGIQGGIPHTGRLGRHLGRYTTQGG